MRIVKPKAKNYEIANQKIEFPRILTKQKHEPQTMLAQANVISITCRCGKKLKKITKAHEITRKHKEWVQEKIKYEEKLRNIEEENEENEENETPFYIYLYDVEEWVSTIHSPVVDDISKRYKWNGIISESSVKLIKSMWREIPEEFKEKYRIKRFEQGVRYDGHYY
jgi:hypothetical protein